jgi:LysR family transcriptional regulator, transcriptional activator of nhaA
MTPRFNYRHLNYFWVVAHEGSMTKAAARLDVAVQTVSAQVHELERTLGHQLLRPAGRGLALTAAGQAALRQADEIFRLGEQLPELVGHSARTAQALRLVVGLSDGLPKLAVRSLLEPVTALTDVRLVCHEDDFDDLLADLALHRLDVVLADRGAPPNPNLRLYSHRLGHSPMAWYAPKAWEAAARRGFPASLDKVPVLLPSQQSAVRLRLDQWFAQHALHPRVVGEFDDSALLNTFAAGGMGVFPATTMIHDDLVQRYRVRRIGDCQGVEEHFYAISTERRAQHPLMQRLLSVRR